MSEEVTTEHPLYDYDRLIAESTGLYREWWILWKRIHPEWALLPEKEPEIKAPPKPKHTFTPLTCKRCNRIWTPGATNLLFSVRSVTHLIGIERKRRTYEKRKASVMAVPSHTINLLEIACARNGITGDRSHDAVATIRDDFRKGRYIVVLDQSDLEEIANGLHPTKKIRQKYHDLFMKS